MFEDLIAELREPAAWLVSAASYSGLSPKVTSTRRSHAAQVRLYRRYQSGLSPLPAAPPGTSAHEYGFAFDMIVEPYEALADVGATWVSLGGVWGGQKDPVHFQYPGFQVPSIAEQTTGIGEDILNALIGLIPVLGEEQMAADLLTLFPSLSHNESLLILANPTKFYPYIKALIQAYK